MNNKVWESPVLTSATGRKWNGNSQENGNAGNGNGNGWEQGNGPNCNHCGGKHPSGQCPTAS